MTARDTTWWIGYAILAAYLVCWGIGAIHWLMVEAYAAALVVAHAELGERR